MRNYFSLVNTAAADEVESDWNIGDVQLRIDCQRMAPSDTDELYEILCRFFGNIFLVGGDLIYARGRISHYDYSNVWRVLGRFDVTVD